MAKFGVVVSCWVSGRVPDLLARLLWVPGLSLGYRKHKPQRATVRLLSICSVAVVAIRLRFCTAVRTSVACTFDQLWLSLLQAGACCLCTLDRRGCLYFGPAGMPGLLLFHVMSSLAEFRALVVPVSAASNFDKMCEDR